MKLSNYKQSSLLKFKCIVWVFSFLFFSFRYACSQNIADKYLTKPSVVVTDKNSTCSGDIHNYESMAIYYWPNPANLSAKYIVKDGQMNPEYKKYDGAKIVQFTDRVKALCEAYEQTHDERYGDVYNKDIKAWFLDKNTRMNPNFDYAQFIPNSGEKGNPAGIIDAYNFVDVISTIEKMHSLGNLDDTTHKKLKKWFSKFADWLMYSENGKKERNAANNHSIAYDVLLTKICAFTGNYRVINDISKEMEEHINSQILPDGKQPQELKRTKAMDYSIYNLSHIIDYCLVAKSLNMGFYSANKERIDAAFHYLLQFEGHKEKFPYQEISDWNQCEEKLKKQFERLKEL